MKKNVCIVLNFLVLIIGTCNLYAPPKRQPTRTNAPGQALTHAHDHEDGGASTGARAGNITINFANSASNDQASVQHAHQEQEQVQQQEQLQSMTTIVNISAQLESFLSAHKWTLLFGFLCVGYAGLYKKLRDDQAFLKNKYSWANWRPYNHGDLEHSLLADIQSRYFDPEDPYNHTKPLSRFTHALNYEKKRCDFSLSIYEKLKDYCLTFLFPDHAEHIRRARQAKEKYEALYRLYLRHVAMRNAEVCLSERCICPESLSNYQKNQMSCQLPTN